MAFLIESNRGATSGDKFVCGEQRCLSELYTVVTRAKLHYKFAALLSFFFFFFSVLLVTCLSYSTFRGALEKENCKIWGCCTAVWDLPGAFIEFTLFCPKNGTSQRKRFIKFTLFCPRNGAGVWRSGCARNVQSSGGSSSAEPVAHKSSPPDVFSAWSWVYLPR